MGDTGKSGVYPVLNGDQIAEVRAYATELELPDGTPLVTEGETGYPFFVVVDGGTRTFKRLHGAEMPLAVHGPGTFTGDLSMLTGEGAGASERTAGPTRVLRVDRERFASLVSGCGIGALILAALARRTFNMETYLREQGKLIALGKMAAGLAHELNNPAAAIRGASRHLADAVVALHERAVRHDAGLAEAQRAEAVGLVRWALETPMCTAPDPLAEADAEDAVTSWLEARGMQDAWEVAPTLACVGMDDRRLAEMFGPLRGAALGDAATGLDAALSAACIVREMQAASARITELVSAVKTYTYMDRAALREVDVHEGLDATLAMLGYKLKSGVNVVRAYDRSLPRIRVYGSELSQVWTNLVDNAVHAMGGRGTLTITTRMDGDRVAVEVRDDGPGIPPEVLPRIWEPFFTTKEVGVGTGLGLDIVRHIVEQHHGGAIDVHSVPGDTRFTVRLRREPPKDEAQADEDDCAGTLGVPDEEPCGSPS